VTWWEWVLLATVLAMLYDWIGWWVVPLWIGACVIAFVCLVLAQVVRAVYR
jgi:hypothetical protein